jgi:hypothetical protein
LFWKQFDPYLLVVRYGEKRENKKQKTKKREKRETKMRKSRIYQNKSRYAIPPSMKEMRVVKREKGKRSLTLIQ